MGLPKELSEYNKSKIVILPVGYDSTTSYKTGTRDAPLAIIQASRFMEYYDPELERDFTSLGIATLEPMALETDGPKQILQTLERASDQLLNDNKFIVMLGGEHTLTVAMVRSIAKKYENLGVLQIDAHLDLRESYDGSIYNHACAMRRVVDICSITQVGIRSVSEEEHAFVKSRKLTPFYSWTLRQKPNWKEEVVRQLPEHVYVTIDMDGLDPSIMPAVGTPEPDGLLWHDIVDLLLVVSRERTIIGADFVELSPIPGYISPDYLTSKLVYKLICLAHQ